jgi:hypothetical protein
MPRKIVPIEDGVPLSQFAARVTILSESLFCCARDGSRQDVDVALSALVNVWARLMMISSPDPVGRFRQLIPWTEELIQKTMEHYAAQDAVPQKRSVS